MTNFGFTEDSRAASVVVAAARLLPGMASADIGVEA